ncbi:MAG: GTP-binding protein [Sphingobacteriales bacterium]|nr:MAG: GTP-binding protein [Sphingobacteriales bacterium]
MSTKNITLITGFLGAGKTTLLNSIIAQKKQTRFAIIENEIGEQSIDAELIIKGNDDIIELNNGCLCCTLNDNLYDIINNLWKRNTEWDEVIIEATGIANPANIAHPFLVNPLIIRSFTLSRVICVVDAELIEDQLKDTEEAILQIAFSDIILLNKTQKVNLDYVAVLQNILTQINPFATVLQVNQNDFKVDELYQHQRTPDFKTNPKTFMANNGMLTLSNHSPQKNSLIAPKSSHVKHQHSNIETIFISFPEALDIETLHHRLFVFLLIQAKDVYRIKAIVNGKEHHKKVILQSVGNSIAITEGQEWGNELPMNKIVIIGKNIKILSLEKLFREHIAA